MKALPIVFTFFAVSSIPAFGALDASIKVTGSKQGAIGGAIPVIRFSTQGIVTKDEITGGSLKSGHRQWKPLILDIKPGVWTPSLEKASTTGEPLTLDLTVNNASGKPYYQVHFAGAHASSVTNKMVGGKPVFEITFVFTEITWTWVQGGHTFNDSWGG